MKLIMTGDVPGNHNVFVEESDGKRSELSTVTRVIVDPDGARLEAEPATRGEVGEGLVHGLAGGADQLGELFLGEVVGDHDTFVDRAAEPAREVEQGLRDASGDVGEDESERDGGAGEEHDFHERGAHAGGRSMVGRDDGDAA